jgi:polyisoprenoid-binding protein YceI
VSAEPASADGADALPTGLYRLDPVHTFAVFSVRHAIVGRVDGRFDTIAGSFVVTDDRSAPFGRIEVDIDAASVDTKVDALTFRGRGRQRKDGGELEIAGDLTIRDVTQPVTFDTTVRGATVDSHGRTRMGAAATAALARRDFGLTTELEQESGDSSRPDIHVRLDIEAVLEPGTGTH